jgi:succinate dehydrogenase/fumarate reductase flavoprotein subunit
VPEDQVRSEQDALERLLSREGMPPATVHRKVREVMWRKSGPVRTDTRLREALVELSALRRDCARMRAKDLEELRDAIEAGLMIDVGELVATAALTRTESRGGHWRIDHPRPDNERWLKNVIMSRGADGRPAVRLEPVSMNRIQSLGPCRVGTRWTWGYV